MGAMRPKYGHWVIFEHCMPFNVSRAYDEAKGLDHPRIWTAERDVAMWKSLEDGEPRSPPKSHAAEGGACHERRHARPILAATRPVQPRAATAALSLTGFGNGFETEALPGALPIGRNSPQRCAYGLYAEQLSGSPFTAPRATNERSWLYRIRPTVAHWGRFQQGRCRPVAHRARRRGGAADRAACAGTRSRSRESAVLLEGVRTITTAGDAGTQAGMAAHVYLTTRSMEDEYFYNADGEMLFVPQQGALRLWTEFGIIDVEPGEIAVIPRGVKFRVELPDGPARGYLCENYGGAFTLPERGPIGANCLANPRDFLTPVAAYEDRDAPSDVVKWGGTLWVTRASATRRWTSSPGTATTRRTSTTCAASRRSARCCSTMPTRRSSPC